METITMLDLSRIVQELENLAEEITSSSRSGTGNNEGFVQSTFKLDNEIAFLKVCLKAYLNYLDYEACFNPNKVQPFIDEARAFEDKHWDMLKSLKYR